MIDSGSEDSGSGSLEEVRASKGNTTMSIQEVDDCKK